MKSFLKNSSKNRAQQTPEISPPYPIQNLLSDPRNNPPAQYQNQRNDHTQQTPHSQESVSAGVDRSQSQRRISSLPNSDLPSSQGGFEVGRQQGSDDFQRPNEYRQSAYNLGGSSGQVPQIHSEEKERRGLRDRLGLKHSKDGRHEHTASSVGRKLSVRGKNSPNPERYSESEGRGHSWSKQSNSSQLLLSPTAEDEESQHNRVANIPAQLGRPPVPQKDGQYEQDYTAQQSQDYYPPPKSQQISTGGAYRGRNSSEQTYLSPEQQLQRQQASQYPDHNPQYPEQQRQHQQGQSHQYQHYPPPPQGLSSGQAQGHTSAFPPPYIVTLDKQNQGQQNQLQHSPDDSQAQYSSQLQTQASEEPVEIHQPQASRAYQGKQEDSLLHAPPSNQQVHGTPSPIQGQSAEQYLATPQQPPSPNELQQPAPSAMPNPARSGGGAMRPIDGSQPSYRGPPSTQDGRSTPGASEKIVADMTAEEVEHYHQLIRDHKELKDKYQKVKKYYFEKESQVHELQNALANQRLSASRTSLDDSEYTARFKRLDGLISQLAFSIRKSWTSIPDWLHQAVNKDAMATGKQEMTAVGRAFISWWLYSEIFERIFHPELDINLSLALKGILTNLRRFAPPCTSEVEEQNLSSKLVSWRMATVEGLQDQFRSPASQQHRTDLLQHLNAQLIGDISAYLTEPAPPDLAGGVYMIVELAANIISHLPLESREVVIDYYFPMSPIQPDIMKIEQGIPQLTSPISGNAPDDTDIDSVKDTLGGNSDNSKEEDQAPPPPPHKEEVVPKGRRGMLANLMGAASGKQAPAGQVPSQQMPPGVQVGKPGSIASTAPSIGNAKSNGRDTPGQGGKEERVRLSVGLGVGIRNRAVLMPAPVYTVLI